MTENKMKQRETIKIQKDGKKKTEMTHELKAKQIG